MSDRLHNAPTPAMRHALLPWEEEAAFIALHHAWQDQYAPIGPAEQSLVDQLVWLDWRRRRLILAERALHMDSLDRRTSLKEGDALSQRALVVSDTGRTEANSAHAVRANDAEDEEGAELWRECLAAAQASLASIEEDAPGDLARAVELLPEGTQEWWQEHLDDKPDAQADPTAAFIRFLAVDVLPFFRGKRDAHEAGPTIRLQAWGESLDPIRTDKLLALDERLTRQYEKALGMLLRLQEMRVKAVVSK